MYHSIQLSENNFIQESLEQQVSFNLENFTAQCWLKTAGTGSLFKYQSQQTNEAFSVEIIESGKVRFAVQFQDSNWNVESLVGGIYNDQWVQLTAIKTGNELSILINGKTVSIQNGENNFFPIQDMQGICVGGRGNANVENGSFIGELGGIFVWNYALTLETVLTQYENPSSKLEEGLVVSYPFNSGENQLADSLQQNPCYIPLQGQKFELIIENTSPYTFQMVTSSLGDLIHHLPKTILPHSTGVYPISGELDPPYFKVFALYTAEQQVQTHLSIELYKSLDFFNSYIRATVSPDLERDIKEEKDEFNVTAKLIIAESLVLVVAKNLNQFISELSAEIGAEKILTAVNYNDVTGVVSSSKGQLVTYNQASQVFNTRIQEKPLAIVYCTRTEDVISTYQKAIQYNLPVRVRSGGHDHEGECTGTNVIVIDLIGLDEVFTGFGHRNRFSLIGLAIVGPGNRFSKLTTELAEKNVMIPHGTCASVAIPGFTMGGGWGPWTRSKGMCCEHLIGAEIVLGDGTCETIASENITNPGDGRDIYILKKNKPELLWALKGGGGMSYGIVTKLYFQTFELPSSLFKFELEWNLYDDQQQIIETTPTINILKRWEAIINSTSTGRLIGTNLKINGKHYAQQSSSFDSTIVVHNCVMYGYWEGDLRSLNDFVFEQFEQHQLPVGAFRIDGGAGINRNYGANLMNSWDRESYQNIVAFKNGQNGIPLPPDLDEPAPHKITSRLVDAQGLGNDGHEALLRSLTSPFILEGNRLEGLFTYVTLGAITGDYYRTMSSEEQSKSAFPYKDKQYTIQYQVWWNEPLIKKEELQDNPVYTRVNRALDWIEVSRDFFIPNTSGAFISFKDSSIPTKTYFGKSYEKLKEIKEQYSKDTLFNHFRTRKTII